MRPASFPEHLVILGGGSAGWMSAAYLDRTFNRPGDRRLRITVVESETIGRIGVGEATIPSIRDFARFIGIDEATLMARTSATFKHGVEFEDWSSVGEKCFHPFEALDTAMGMNAGPSWLARWSQGIAGTFADEAGIQWKLARAGLSPKRLIDPDYSSVLPYAYHLDAEAYGDLLAEVALARGVERVTGDVVGVRQKDGDVLGLDLGDGTTVDGDLFLDCSGFNALLLGKALKSPFLSYADHLLCDRAVAIRAPHDPETPIPPMTRARALSAGWMWRIGLQNREGLGYVYSSAHIKPAEAEAELRAATGLADDVPARHLTMRIGRAEKAWTGNVIALGLAGGFIEPLESTGLHMVEYGLEMLVRHFPLSGLNPDARDRFNEVVGQHYDGLRDFISAHYGLSGRRDTPFWQAATSPEHMPPRVRMLLGLWADRHPSVEDISSQRPLFGHASWQHILYGIGKPGPAAAANAARWVAEPGAHLPQLEQACADITANLPSHTLWLEGLATLPIQKDGW
ncbi:tryptophan 7-halogenase [Brevundimonas sp.]|uniref:tryptophan halogenase family protein n=1 Tax=Brevundimonas sp. TaxID=1871086 RepID=UPI00248889DC|nr:tryptophan 7-halogenase [Brevundimonas sp.]MDI1281846.1 tryptophan 7-halogenase [Brevundimonas sp.]